MGHRSISYQTVTSKNLNHHTSRPKKQSIVRYSFASFASVRYGSRSLRLNNLPGTVCRKTRKFLCIIRSTISKPPREVDSRNFKITYCRASPFRMIHFLRSPLPFDCFFWMCGRCVESSGSTQPYRRCTCASLVPRERGRPLWRCAWDRSCSAWATVDRDMLWWPPGMILSGNMLATPPLKPRFEPFLTI